MYINHTCHMLLRKLLQNNYVTKNMFHLRFSKIRRGIKESNMVLLATLSIEFTHFIFPVSSKVSSSGSG